MGFEPRSAAGRPRGPLLSSAWVITSILAAMIASDQVERRAHTPLCIDACGNAGKVFFSVPHPILNTIRCDCSARSADRFDISWAEHLDWQKATRSTIRVDMSWSEFVKWQEATLMIAAGLLTMIAGVKWLWRRGSENSRRPSPPL